MNIEILCGWLFTYNPHTGNYRACQREQLNDFFSISEENFLRAKSQKDLEELILKTGGDKKEIQKLLNKYKKQK
jgi:hypothetical protein